MSQRSQTFKVIIYLTAVILVTKNIPMLPWWSFVVPTIGLGILIAKKGYKIHHFITGFFCGFIIWIVAVLVFHFWYGGRILHRFDKIQVIVMLTASGILGGILTGLGLFTGKAIVQQKDAGLF